MALKASDMAIVNSTKMILTMIAHNRSLERKEKLYMMQDLLETVFKAHGYDVWVASQSVYHIFLTNFTPVKYISYRKPA